MLQSCSKTCVVHEDVYTTKWLKVLDALSLRAHVEVECNTLSALSLDLCLECLEALLAAASDDNLGVWLSKA